jgi:hypothetical protein
MRELNLTHIVTKIWTLRGLKYVLRSEHARWVKAMQKLLAPAVHLHNQRLRPACSVHVGYFFIFFFSIFIYLLCFLQKKTRKNSKTLFAQNVKHNENRKN